MFNPFSNTWICNQRGRVRIHNPGDYLVSGSGSVDIYAAKGFCRKVSDCCVKDGCPCGGRVLIGGVVMCPPVIFGD
jgi:hypothetical protein